MKRLIILFLIPFIIFAQNYDVSVKSAKNSTTTTLDSAATYTGTAELTRGYNSLSVTVRSDSAGTYKILFGNSTSITTANAIKTWSFSYTAGDTLHTKHVPIVAPYYKVVYTNSADTQNVFLLTTMLHQGHNLPTTANARLDVDISSSALPSGAATSANQTTLIAKADSTVDMVTAIHADVDAVEAKLDSLDASSTRIEGYVDGVEAKLDSIDASSTRIESKIDNTNTKLDSIEVTVNNIESKVATEAKQDTMEVSLNAIQTAVGTTNTKLDSIDASSTRIETKLDNSNVKLDSLDASTTRIEGYVDGLEVKADTANARLEEIKLDVETMKSILDGASTFVSNNLAVTTAAPLHSNTACKKVIVTNYTAGEYVYVGNASVSTSNGFPLGYLDSITLTVSNLNLVYVVSDGTSCDIRFSYEN